MQIWKVCPTCQKKVSTFFNTCTNCGTRLSEKIKMTPRARSKGAARKKYAGKR